MPQSSRQHCAPRRLVHWRGCGRVAHARGTAWTRQIRGDIDTRAKMGPVDAVEQRVAKQGADIVKRAASGEATGTFKVGELGPRLVSAIMTFVTSSDQAERAYRRFL